MVIKLSEMPEMKISDSYFEFYLFRFNKNSIALIPRSSPNFNVELFNPFYHFGLFAENFEGFINYYPGTYDPDFVFYKHPIKIGEDVYLIKIRERNLMGISTLGLSTSEKAEHDNPKGIEISLKIRNNNSIVDYTLYTNNDIGISNAVKSLYYFNLYLDLGFQLGDFNSDFGKSLSIGLMEKNQKKCYTRIFEFVNQLKFISWSEVLSRPGRDSGIESGIKILNELNESYFIYLINEYSDFNSNDGKIFNGRYESDNGCIPSSPYKEREISGFDKKVLQNEIVNILIKYYNKDLDILHTFFKKFTF